MKKLTSIFLALMLVLALLPLGVLAQESEESLEATEQSDTQLAESDMSEPIEEGKESNRETYEDILEDSIETGVASEVVAENLKLSLDGDFITGGSCGKYLRWAYDSTGILTIRGTGSMPSYDQSGNAPWYSLRGVITGVKIEDGVTGIGAYAFWCCIKLTSISIPNSVTGIGSHAFDGCSKLTNVSIPDSVKDIGTGTFDHCSSLTNVTIPDGVRSIAAWMFRGCSSLTKVTIPDSVTSIGDLAFSYCTSLASVEIPSGVINIGNSAFEGCSSLINISIPENVKDIGEGAFSDCTSLTSVTIPSGVRSVKDNTFHRCTSLTSVSIPSGVTSIGEYAFYDCESLTCITIPEKVTHIGDYAFTWCKSLTSITIPSSMTSIGVGAFENVSALKDVYYADTEMAWNTIDIGDRNDDITKATKHYTSSTTAHEHTWDTGMVTTEPTCTTAGVKTFTCTYDNCEATKTETTDALGHDFGGEYLNDKTQHWQRCQREGCTEISAKTAHSGGTATCAKKASCSVCGAAYGTVLSHAWDEGKVTKEATTEAEGVKTYTCTVCKATRTEAIEKLIPVEPKPTEEPKSTEDTKNADSAKSAARTDDAKKPPRTGDEGDLTFWFAVALLGGCAVAGTTIVAKKKNYTR